VGNGSPYHPMTASNDPNVVHFITHIYVLDQSSAFVAMSTLDPTGGGVAQMTFDIPITATQLVAYEWCNKHGLWRGPPVNVSAGPNAGSCTKPAMAIAAQPSWISDFHRRQAMAPFSSTDPYVESNGKKHTPYIRVDGSQGTVTVGDGSPFHPMVGSTDPATVHYVTHIYVVDQTNKVIAMENLDPTNVAKASITFVVPSDATSLTAYEWCNLHGLWKGPIVNLTTAAKGERSGMRLGLVAVNVISAMLSLMV